MTRHRTQEVSMVRSWFRTRGIGLDAMALAMAIGALGMGLTAPVSAQPFTSYNVYTYGANGADGVDDTAAIQAAINAIPVNGRGEVYLPAGRYLLSSTLNATNRSVAFRGEGQGITKLVWYAGVNGISFASALRPSGTPHDTLEVRSLSLLRSAGNGGAAITATWPLQTGAMWHGNGGAVTATIFDVHIASDPWPAGDVYWWFGIQLNNATVAKIGAFNIQGASYAGGIAAIQITGTPEKPAWPTPLPNPNPYGKSIAIYIRDGSISRYVRGVEMKSFSEGLHLNNIDMRETSWGLWVWNASGGTVVTDCFFQSKIRGILLEQQSGLKVANNTINQFLDDAFVGIELSSVHAEGQGGPAGAQITGNTIDSPNGGANVRAGIQLTGDVDLTMVQNNTIHNMHRGIWITGGTGNADQNHVVGNVIRGWSIGAIVNVSGSTFLADNIF
jgi:hypothetical protein